MPTLQSGSSDPEAFTYGPRLAVQAGTFWFALCHLVHTTLASRAQTKVCGPYPRHPHRVALATKQNKSPRAAEVRLDDAITAMAHPPRVVYPIQQPA